MNWYNFGTLYAAVPPSRYFPQFTPVQSLPVRPGIVPGSQKYICSPIITVHYGLPRSTHVNTRSNKSGSSRWTPVSSRWTSGKSRWTPGSSRSTYGGHPFLPVNTRFIPVNTRFITVPYGSLRFITVHYGSSRSTHGSLRLTTVHYGSLRE